MTVAGRVRDRVLSGAIADRLRQYERYQDEPARRAIQLGLWNTEWQRILAESDYYHRLAGDRGLPSRFRCWEEFRDLFPVTTRGFLQRHAGRIKCRSKPADFFRITGGTTAQPIQLPAWQSELDHTRVDIWVGRSWYGIRPSSGLFLIWGHSHLLGTGARGWLRARRRDLADWLLGYHRFSAYDLQPEALRRAAAELIRFRPEYVLGYSVALDLFARVNSGLSSELGGLGVKVVIGAAEAFPAADSRTRLEQLFGCPVAMEYGSVETNLMAHTHPEGGYRTFWQSYFIEAAPAINSNGARKILVTSLYPRCVPLIRYEVGDEVLVDAEGAEAAGLSRFQRVAGRSNDYVSLPDGALIHSEAFTHAVRCFAEVRGYQVLQTGQDVAIRVLSDEPLPAVVEEGIRSRLGRIHHALSSAPIERVPRLDGTIAGKTPMILRQ